MNFLHVLPGLIALVWAAPAAAEPVRTNVDRVFDAFLTCKVEFFDLLMGAQADFPAREFQVLEDHVAPVWVERRLVPFSSLVYVFGMPISGYIQQHTEAATGPGLTWGFRVNRGPAEVMKTIEARLSGSRFVAVGDGGFELRLEPKSDAAIWVPPGKSYRGLLVFQADTSSHSFVFCSASEDMMSELKTDNRTGRKRLPATTGLFVLPKIVNEEDVLEEFSHCAPKFFATLPQAKERFGRVTVEPLSVVAPDGKTGEVSGSTVTFAEPVRAFGLDLTGYTQMLHKKDGKPVAFWWGFRTSDDATITAHWLSTRAETLSKAQRIGWGEWVMETRPRATADGGAEEELDYRVFKVDRSSLPLLTNVFCGATVDMMGDMTAFPEPETLFKQ